MVANLIGTLILKRSILTEKVARRGFHVVREYGVEPLEGVLAQEVMRKEILTVASDSKIDTLRELFQSSIEVRRQRIYPVADESGIFIGVLLRLDILLLDSSQASEVTVEEMMMRSPVVAYVGETLRTVAERMAEREIGAVPVVEIVSEEPLVRGIITESDILRSRQRQLVEERARERILGRTVWRV